MAAAHLAEMAAAATAHAGLQPGDSYNVLLTDQWLLTVPRGADGDGVVSANALGFAGAFLVRGEAEREHVKSHDPMGILAKLGVPW
jgi:sulfate adenylyltransferase (ADP) / ATP adenylyltransferase